jgi:hypothetical protein
VQGITIGEGPRCGCGTCDPRLIFERETDFRDERIGRAAIEVLQRRHRKRFEWLRC